jgi:hypothetical protein
MSLAELKEHIQALNVEERLELAAWIAYLNRSADPSYQTELDTRMARMDAGRKSSKADLELLHKELGSRGQ